VKSLRESRQENHNAKSNDARAFALQKELTELEKLLGEKKRSVSKAVDKVGLVFIQMTSSFTCV